MGIADGTVISVEAGWSGDVVPAAFFFARASPFS
jgi:hypothetical protein